MAASEVYYADSIDPFAISSQAEHGVYVIGTDRPVERGYRKVDADARAKVLNDEREPSGITVEVYSSQLGTFANGGLSDRCKQAVLILPGGGPVKPTFDRPGIEIVTGSTYGTVKAVPIDTPGDKAVGPMMGGNYVATSDSRFSAEVERVLGERFYGAVALHDRWETPAQYEALSR